MTRHGQKVVSMKFAPQREIDLDGLDFYFRSLPLTTMRHIPDIEVPPRGRPLIHDLTQMVMSNVSFGQALAGPAALEFGRADNEELLPLQPQEVLGGYRVPMKFRLDGVRVIYDYLAHDDLSSTTASKEKLP